jgi:hypothetical protein
MLQVLPYITSVQVNSGPWRVRLRGRTGCPAFAFNLGQGKWDGKRSLSSRDLECCRGQSLY